MKYYDLFPENQKKELELCKEFKKSTPEIQWGKVEEFFSSNQLPDLEHLLLAMLKNSDEFEQAIVVFSNFLKEAEEDTLASLYEFLTPISDFDIIKPSVIFVYGTKKSPARAVFAADLYKEFPGTPIIVSDQEESAYYKKVLIDKGVPEDNIFEENEGCSYVENAFCSIRLAEKLSIPLENIFLVTASLVALRGKLTTEIFLDENSNVYSKPVEYDKDNPNDPTTPENWYKNSLGVKTFLLELIKLYVMKEMELIRQGE